jgi:2,4-dienoyl-CoA reductase-like NADH-dependent reductase (Old Yellow Enzyme family)/thioredoxin reductase
MLRMMQPMQIGRVELRNRILSAPMERNLSGVDGRLTDEYIGYLEARAAGGVALTFTEAAYVRIDGKGRRRQMGVHEDETIPGLRRLAEAVHARAGLVGVELNHGGRTAQGRISGYNCVAPSPVPCEVMGGELPLELDEEEIEDIIGCYAEGARRCAEAGIDVLSLHAAHGYLVHQFLSPRTNLREDSWRDPLRFITRVIEAIRGAVPEMPFGMRISAFEGPLDGLDADDTFALISQAPLRLLDFLDISAGSYEAGEWIVQPGEWHEGLLAEHAARYRQLGLPTSVAGRITRVETVERVLADSADMVSMARALHADPNWVTAAAGGRPIRPCIACNLCIDQLKTGEPIPCSVNPHVGREHEPPPPMPARALSVLVVGAGPAGLEASRALAALGHHVTLVERRERIGGDFRLASRLHEYPEYHRILDWYEIQLAELGVELRLGEEAHLETTIAADADAVVLATGGFGQVPEVPGYDCERVVEIREWMIAGQPDLGDDVHVIWGADREGVAVADELLQHGKRILIIGAQHDLAPDVGRRAKILVVPRLKGSRSVDILLEARVTAIEPTRVRVRELESGEEGWLDLKGPILVSQGVTPDTGLHEALRQQRLAGLWVLAIGEAGGQGGYIATAIADGARVAAELNARATATAAV